MKKNLPSKSQSLTLINACFGERLVRSRNCVAHTETNIDFEIKANSQREHPLNYALSRLWRNLGTQASTCYAPPRQLHGARATYEWKFTPPAGKLRLMFMMDGRVLVSLVNEPLERRSNAAG